MIKVEIFLTKIANFDAKYALFFLDNQVDTFEFRNAIFPTFVGFSTF